MSVMVSAASERIAESTEHGVRRNRVISLLNKASRPLPVDVIAQYVGVHVNTARFHLEALVDAGLATRQAEVRPQPGRRRVLYSGAEAAPHHQPAEDYRLLTVILTAAIAAHYPDTGGRMYEVGKEWGHYLTTRPAPYEVVDEAEIENRILDKFESLWFSPEFGSGANPHLRVRNCPFMESAQRAPDVVCQLHCGIINGALEEMGSRRQIVEMDICIEPDLCHARLARTDSASLRRVVLNTPSMRVHADEVPV